MSASTIDAINTDIMTLAVPVKSTTIAATSDPAKSDPAKLSSPVRRPACESAALLMKKAYAAVSHTDNLPLDVALRCYLAENNLSHERFPDEGARMLTQVTTLGGCGDGPACVSRTSVSQREIAHPFLDALRFAAAHGSSFVLNPNTLWHIACDGLAQFFQRVNPVAQKVRERRHKVTNGPNITPPSYFLDAHSQAVADNPLSEPETRDFVRNTIAMQAAHFVVSGTVPLEPVRKASTAPGDDSTQKSRRLDDAKRRFPIDLISERIALPIANDFARDKRYACLRMEPGASTIADYTSAANFNGDDDDDDDDSYGGGGGEKVMIFTYRIRQYEIERKAGEWMRLFSTLYEFAVVDEPACSWLAPIICIVFGVLTFQMRFMKQTDDDYPVFDAAAANFVFEHAARLQLTLTDLSADLAQFFWCDELRTRKSLASSLHLHGIALYLFPGACGIFSACNAAMSPLLPPVSSAEAAKTTGAEMDRVVCEQQRAAILDPANRSLLTAAFVNELRVADHVIQTATKLVTLRSYTGIVGFVYHRRKNAVAPALQSFAVVEHDKVRSHPLWKSPPTVLGTTANGLKIVASAATDTEGGGDVAEADSSTDYDRAEMEQSLAAETGSKIRDMIRLVDASGGSTQLAFARVLSHSDLPNAETTNANHWPVSYIENPYIGQDFIHFEYMNDADKNKNGDSTEKNKEEADGESVAEESVAEESESAGSVKAIDKGDNDDDDSDDSDDVAKEKVAKVETVKVVDAQKDDPSSGSDEQFQMHAKSIQAAVLAKSLTTGESLDLILVTGSAVSEQVTHTTKRVGSSFSSSKDAKRRAEREERKRRVDEQRRLNREAIEKQRKAAQKEWREQQAQAERITAEKAKANDARIRAEEAREKKRQANVAEQKKRAKEARLIAIAQKALEQQKQQQENAVEEKDDEPKSASEQRDDGQMLQQEAPSHQDEVLQKENDSVVNESLDDESPDESPDDKSPKDEQSEEVLMFGHVCAPVVETCDSFLPSGIASDVTPYLSSPEIDDNGGQEQEEDVSELNGAAVSPVVSPVPEIATEITAQPCSHERGSQEEDAGDLQEMQVVARAEKCVSVVLQHSLKPASSVKEAVDRFIRHCVPPSALFTLEPSYHTCKKHRDPSSAAAVASFALGDAYSLYEHIAATCDAHFPCVTCCAERGDSSRAFFGPPPPLCFVVDETSDVAIVFRQLFEQFSVSDCATVATSCAFCKRPLTQDCCRTMLLFNGIDQRGEAQLRVMWRCAANCDGSFDNQPFALSADGVVAGAAMAPRVVARGFPVRCYVVGGNYVADGDTYGSADNNCKTFLRFQTMSFNVQSDLVFEVC